jgi:HPt (histidine-containing phosphotransfer) domain-containing protein
VTTDPAAALSDLKQRFLQRSADDLAKLLDYADGGAVSAEEIRYLVHRLAGAAGIFGFPALSDAAARLDAALVENAALDPEAMRPLIADLEAVLRGG